MVGGGGSHGCSRGSQVQPTNLLFRQIIVVVIISAKPVFCVAWAFITTTIIILHKDNRHSNPELSSTPFHTQALTSHNLSIESNQFHKNIWEIEVL